MNYDYKCTNEDCEHIWEESHGMSDDPEIVCPICGTDKTEKLITGGSGVHFHGTGWTPKYKRN